MDGATKCRIDINQSDKLIVGFIDPCQSWGVYKIKRVTVLRRTDQYFTGLQLYFINKTQTQYVAFTSDVQDYCYRVSKLKAIYDPGNLPDHVAAG